MRWDYRPISIISFWRISESISAISIIILWASALLLSVPIYAYEEAISFEGESSSFNLTDCSRIVWYVDPSEGHIAFPSLHSGPIRSGGTSCVEKWIYGPASINFWWKVDQDTRRAGMLAFMVDDEIILQCHSTEWSPVDYAVSSGNHKLSWVYRKLNSYPEYAGAGWIDDIKIAYPKERVLEVVGENVSCCDQMPSIIGDIARIDDSLSGLDVRMGRIDLEIGSLSSGQAALDDRTKKVEGDLDRVDWSIGDIYSQIINLNNNDTRLVGLVKEFNITLDGRLRDIVNSSINQTACNLSCLSDIEEIDRNLSEVNARVGQIDDKMGRINESIYGNIYPQITNLSINYTRAEGLVKESNNSLNERLHKLDARINEVNEIIANLSINETDLDNLSWISENVVYVSDPNTNLTDVISKSENKIVLLGDGIYHTGGLNIETSDVYIRSIRKWGAVLDADGADDGVVIDSVNGIQNVTLEALIITDCINGIHIQNGTNCNSINNFINNFNRIGIGLSSSNQCIFMQNIFKAARSSTAQNGFHLEDSDKNLLVFNDVNISLDNSSSLYNVLSSKDNKILVSNRGYIWDEDINCINKDNNVSGTCCTKNNLPTHLPLQNNTWEFC